MKKKFEKNTENKTVTTVTAIKAARSCLSPEKTNTFNCQNLSISFTYNNVYLFSMKSLLLTFVSDFETNKSLEGCATLGAALKIKRKRVKNISKLNFVQISYQQKLILNY